jgi:hypothetical protein
LATAICKVEWAYSRNKEEHRSAFKGVCFDVLEVTKRTVKIQWNINDGKYKFGYLAHRQFLICAEENKSNRKATCDSCVEFGNCIYQDSKKTICSKYRVKEGK